MKIAFIGQKGIPARFGGVEYHVDHLSRDLAGRGHQVSVYVRDWYTDRSLKYYQGVRLVHIPTLRTKHLDASIHSFLCSVHCLFTKTEIIHYQGIGPSFFSFIPKIFGRKVVSTVHRLDWATEKWGSAAKFFIKSGEWMAVHLSHRTITVSEALQGFIRTAHHKDAVFIPNGIQLSPSRPIRILKEKYGLSERQFILYLGRLVPEKRPDWLIQAFLELSRKSEAFRTLKLVIAGGSGGTDDYVRRLKKLGRENPDVIFSGYVWGEEKEELLSQALVFVLPSYLEGNPIALLEAKSYGLCCLASDIGPHQEVIQPGRDGQLFRSGDRRDLKAKLFDLVENPEEGKRLGKNAREDIRKRKTWEEVAEMTLNGYRDILASGR